MFAHFFFIHFKTVQNCAVHSSENEHRSEIYWNMEKMCRKTTKIMIGYVLIQEQMFVVTFVYSIYCICIGNTDTSSWPLPINLFIPFNAKAQTTLCGWYLLWLFQFNGSAFYSLCTMSTTSYFVCCCHYIMAICNHFESLMQSINGNVEQNSRQQNERKYKRNVCIVERELREAVDLHVKINK